MLKVEDLCYKYPNQEFPIIEKLSFDFHKRNLVLITGENGAGKTTLFFCLTAYICQYLGGELSGSVMINNHQITSLETRERLKLINCSFQDPDIQITFSKVYEELLFQLKQTETLNNKKEQEIQDYLKLFELEIDSKTNSNELSWGQKKIICLICLLVNDPQIYLLDEPFSGLSLHHCSILREILYQKRNENRLILITDHTQYPVDYNQIFNLKQSQLTETSQIDETLVK